jgi:antitoxin component YwqK of YwqJK toxin-antitoxin module
MLNDKTMNKTGVFFGMMFYCFVAFGCDCIENNQTLGQLDEYSLLNAQLAVIIETGEATSDGENIVLKANIVSYIKKSAVRSFYLKGKDEGEYGFELTKMANKKLVLINVEFFGDTIVVNHCKQLWVWYDNPNEIKSRQDYFVIMQRQYAIQCFLDKSSMEKHNKIAYTNTKNTSFGLYKNGLPEGRWSHFTYYGKLFARGEYVNGMKEGKWVESYYKQKVNGHKIALHRMGFAKGNYVNGKRDGMWVIFNKQNGPVTLFYRDGQIFERKLQNNL